MAHGIKISDCTNVIIHNFTVTQTGGDGFDLGASNKGVNKNVLVDDMNFDDNHRLGMAVISVDGLIIRRTKFVNTLGTGPNGGIDFEPNHSGQQLKNIVLEIWVVYLHLYSPLVPVVSIKPNTLLRVD